MTGLRPLSELVEEAADRLTSEQLRAIAARVEAAEARQAEPQAAPVIDVAAEVALDLDAAVRHLLGLWVEGIGIDPDIAAAWLLPQLARAGAPEDAARAALEEHAGWRPRSDAERWEAVAAAMLRDGWSGADVRKAIAAVARKQAAA